MSGGVDSAVALLRARPDAVGVTLRLWLDPDGPDAERACCSPEAVIAARETCHRLGLPHVTLDLREEFRRAVVAPFVRGYARGETPNPCIRCNGGFRFGELLAFASARRLRRGSRPATTRASPSIAAGACCTAAPTRAKDQSYMLARLDPEQLERIWFPLGEQDKADDAREAAARRARRRAARREPGGVLPRRRRLPRVPRRGTASRRAPARSSTSRAASSARTTASGGSRRGSGKGIGVVGGDAAVRARDRPGDEHRRRRPARVARAHAASPHRDASTSTSTAPTAKLRYRSPAVAARRVADAPAASSSSSTSRRTASRAGQAAVLYEGDAVVGCGLVSSAA